MCMSVSVSVFLFLRVYMRVHVHLRASGNACARDYIYALSVYLPVYRCVSMSAYVWVCACMFLHVCVCVCCFVGSVHTNIYSITNPMRTGHGLKVVLQLKENKGKRYCHKSMKLLLLMVT